MQGPGPDSSFIPHIWVFLCDCCLELPDREMAQILQIRSAHITKVNGLCLSRFKASFLKEAFDKGADGVILCGCQIGKCQHSDNLQSLKIIYKNQLLMSQLVLDPNRLGQEYLAPGCTKDLQSCVASFAEKIQKMGPVRPPAANP